MKESQKNSILLKENDAAEIMLILADLMEQWILKDGCNIKYCSFCRKKENHRGKLIHSDKCTGNNIYNKLFSALNTPLMNSARVIDLLDQDILNPIEGVDAIKWLVNNYDDHQIKKPFLFQMVNDIKKKLGIPF